MSQTESNSGIDGRHIVIFDGVCNLCNGSVSFIIKRDPKGKFVFIPMQSSLAEELIVKYSVAKVGVDTFLVIKDDRAYVYSDAALEIAKELSGIWAALYLLRFVPRVVRNGCYKTIARNRYKLFGRTNTCMVPTEEISSRFL